MTTLKDFEIRPAADGDAPLVMSFIKKLAVYEKLAHKVTATEDLLRETLFGERRYAEVIIGYDRGEPVGFALFFHNYSTFLGKPGVYLEDLYVDEEHRGRGFGKALLGYLAKLAKERNCGRLEWSVLNWNEPSINFYKALGAAQLDDWMVFRVTGDALDKLANVGVDDVMKQ
jgi:GNAT superfamily N-acetyltransferase